MTLLQGLMDPCGGIDQLEAKDDCIDFQRRLSGELSER